MFGHVSVSLRANIPLLKLKVWQKINHVLSKMIGFFRASKSSPRRILIKCEFCENLSFELSNKPSFLPKNECVL